MKLPTWVPHWSVPRLSESIQISACCPYSKPQVRYQDGSILAATGVHVALIKCVESLPQPASPAKLLIHHKTEDAEDAIRALIVPKMASLSLSERDATVSSLCRTICCNLVADSYSPPSSNYPDFAIWRKYIHRIIDTTQDAALEDSLEGQKYLHHVDFAIKGRSFFTTVDGSIGLAPIATKPGDEVCILLGCKAPLVIRPCGDGSHKVVGECYIDGFMDGAPCLGPLPSKWQPVLHYFEQFSMYFSVFLDHQTGELQVEDPRLGPLPGEWYILDHEKKDAYNVFANDETGERTGCDPRMTPETLTARGVEMREFRLV